MRYLLLALFSITTITLTAQITTGTLQMAITDIEVEMEEGAQVADMMKGLEMTIYFKPGMTVTDMNMMGMIDMRMIQEGDKMTQYSDMMGQKMKIVTDLKDYSGMGIGDQDIENMYKITPMPGKSKQLLGFDCKAYEILFDMSKMEVDAEVAGQMKNMRMIAYITEEIKMEQLSLQQLKGLKMPGAPLEMIIDMGMMKMTYAATEFSKDVPEGAFDAPEGDYREMSMEDLQKMGMGQGFGF